MHFKSQNHQGRVFSEVYKDFNNSIIVNKLPWNDQMIK